MDSEEKKISIDFAKIQERVINFDTGETIYKVKIVPYIPLTTKVDIIRNYLESLYSPEIKDDAAIRYMGTQYMLMLEIIERLTNISIDGLNVDLVYQSGLWDKIIAEIPDYPKFKKEIDLVVEFYEFQKTLEKSVGNIVDGLSVKILDILSKIEKMDIDKLKEISQEFTSRLDDLNKTIPGIAESKSDESSKPIAPIAPVIPIVKRGRKKKVS